MNESEDDELFIKDISDVKVENWRLSNIQKEMKIDDLNDSNEMNQSNEMKMIEQIDLDSSLKYVLKDEIFENERMSENEDISDSQLMKK